MYFLQQMRNNYNPVETLVKLLTNIEIVLEVTKQHFCRKKIYIFGINALNLNHHHQVIKNYYILCTNQNRTNQSNKIGFS
jgi:hypothetical protein